MKISENRLFEVPVPTQTATYAPISNKAAIELIKETLDKKNLKIKDAKYSTNGNCNQMFGVMTIETGHNEQDISIGFRNSYDKTLPFGLVAGSRVIVCENLCFAGDIKVLRKHTPGIYKELGILIDTVTNYSMDNYERILEDAESFKSIEKSKTEIAELLGRMFIEDEIITSTQLNIIKRELDESTNFKGNTLWDIYNHATEAFKTSHAKHVMNDHIKLHRYFLEEIK